MNEVNISTEEQPIIGTDSLGPCVGVLIYSKKFKKSIVFHASTNWQSLIIETLIIMAENNLISVENFNKSIENFELHEKYDLYSFDNITKKSILSKKGLLITGVGKGDDLEVTVIPGYYPDNYQIATNITKFFLTLSPMITIRKNELPKKAVRTRMYDDLGSHEFFFDSSTGKFVTEKIKNSIDSKRYRL